MKFIHSADIHLDSPLQGLERYEGAPADQIRGASRRALEKLVDLALSEKVDFILIAGDLYDGDWRDYGTGLFFSSQMSRLSRENIKVFTIRGNHDAASTITRQLRLPDIVHDFSTRKPETFQLPDLSTAIHGQGFAKAAVTDNLASSYPDPLPGFFNIGLLHTGLGGREGHENYAPCTADLLASKGYQYWALGHAHKREVVSEDPYIVFSGNIQGRHAKETGDKGCTLVTVADGYVESVEHRSLDVLRWLQCEVDAKGAEYPEDVVELTRTRLQEELALAEGMPLAVRLLLTGCCRAHDALAGDPDRWVNELRAMTGELRGGQVWVEKVKLLTSLELNLDELVERRDPVGDLFRFVREMGESDEALSGLLSEFADLKRKLPPELRQDQEAVNLDSVAGIRGLLGEVEGLLASRLFREGVKP